MPATPDNPKGYWEDNAVVDFNDELLQRLGKTWASIDADPSKAGALGDVPELRERAIEIISPLRLKPIWGFKDPRTIYVLPFWQRILDHLSVDVYYVIALRHPGHVALSLERRDQFPPLISYFLWLNNILSAIHLTRNEHRVVVDYARFLDSPQPQLERLASSLSLPIPPQPAIDTFCQIFLDPKLDHAQNVPPSHPSPPRLLAEIYELLGQLDPHHKPSDVHALDQWRALETRARDVTDFAALFEPQHAEILQQRELIHRNQATIRSLNKIIEDANKTLTKINSNPLIAVLRTILPHQRRLKTLQRVLARGVQLHRIY